jgi:hypothetical protein
MGFEKGNIVWQLRGTVINKLKLNPLSVYYGETLVHGLTFPTKVVHLEPRELLASLDVTCDPSQGAVTVTRGNNKGEGYTIAVTPAQELPLGPFDFPIVLRATTKTGEQLPPLDVRVRGAIYRDIQAFPHELSLGQQYLNQAVTTDVVISSARSELFEVTDVRHGTDVMDVRAAIEGTADRHRFTVTVLPSALGARTSQLEFVIQKPGNDPEQVSTPIHYAVFDELKTLYIPIDHKSNDR